ncbi:MAG TPA: LysE/ArgO family amino acid transporter [Paucimonas sp.]|nr:LysE/ArgO family amino acid transporter [Paucimonas sp.]
MMLAFFLKGFGLGAGLIVAIGAQNAHVLKSGIKGEHVGLTVAICIVCDIVLIAAGVAGMGAVIRDNPLLLAAARWGGAGFLAWYGLRTLGAAWRGDALRVDTAAGAIPMRQAASTTLALTLLNPHVYLDTVVLLGAIGAQQAGGGKPWFMAGAMSASTAWFILLGFGARRLAPWFAKPAAWRMLDAGIACFMLALAASLAIGG